MLARTTERHTSLIGRVLPERQMHLSATLADGRRDTAEFRIGDAPDGISRWGRYAAAVAAVLDQRHGPLSCGVEAQLSGSMIAAGLSSSASYLLAVITALATANDLELDQAEQVDAVREVEHAWFGLVNGIQDQLSILYGRANALSLIDPDAVAATHVSDSVVFREQASWLLCYSGVSRELADSSYNSPVEDCHAAAALLQPGVNRLGDVDLERRSGVGGLPEPLARRAQHVYGEMARVDQGVAAWRVGDLHRFGELMNASCRSSIDLYESGSEWLVALHDIAGKSDGVYGSRFSGGGYGGCLVMLADANRVDAIASRVLEQYCKRYPDLRGLAHCFDAGSADGVRVAQGV